MATLNLNFDKAILFGDSITQYCFNPEPTAKNIQFGYGSAMQNIYARKLDIIQRGFSGYNSENALILLPKILSIETNNNISIKFITVFFGTNDAALGGPERVELSRYAANMAKITKMIIDHGIRPILIGPGYHNADTWNPTRPEEVANGIIRSTENNKLYSDCLEKVAVEFNVPFVNMFKLFKDFHNNEGDFNELLSDGIHFSGKGYKLMFQEVLKIMLRYYPEIHPDNIPKQLPHWTEISIEELKAI